MARIEPPSIRSASARAAVMVLVLATIAAALGRLEAPSSASAIARADAVRFSIRELAADSVRRRMAENGAISTP